MHAARNQLPGLLIVAKGDQRLIRAFPVFLRLMLDQRSGNHVLPVFADLIGHRLGQPVSLRIGGENRIFHVFAGHCSVLQRSLPAHVGEGIAAVLALQEHLDGGFTVIFGLILRQGHDVQHPCILAGLRPSGGQIHVVRPGLVLQVVHKAVQIIGISLRELQLFIDLEAA